MKLVFNGTTLVKGGALQAAANFIVESFQDEAYNWTYILSQELFDQAVSLLPDLNASSCVHILDSSPARDLKSRRKLRHLVDSKSADLVFTFFGPAYVDFVSTHLMGFAEPWVTHPNRFADATVGGPLKSAVNKLISRYKKSWLPRADYWVVESEVARVGLARIVEEDTKDIFVVKNGCRDVFKSTHCAVDTIELDDEIRLLYLSAFYPHKNYLFIPEVARRLRDTWKGKPVKFVLSLDEQDSAVGSLVEKIREYGVADSFEFYGPVSLRDAPAVYQRCHIAFIPTLLESFSATYPEAMSVGMPVITTNMDFSRAICHDAAAYFEPNDVAGAAEQIIRVLSDRPYREGLIARGRNVVSNLPDANAKYQQYVSIVNQAVSASGQK